MQWNKQNDQVTTTNSQRVTQSYQFTTYAQLPHFRNLLRSLIHHKSHALTRTNVPKHSIQEHKGQIHKHSHSTKDFKCQQVSYHRLALIFDHHQSKSIKLRIPKVFIKLVMQGKGHRQVAHFGSSNYTFPQCIFSSKLSSILLSPSLAQLIHAQALIYSHHPSFLFYYKTQMN